ncbi:Uncharacterised protein [Vibrio cholerae]|uniref:Uncharacterized protein n=1 Tax=Vibrio cholerae TaxID=666 RepID=A0A655P526_VIBCL|nr:Uncharacterised protein [Vibrio cholerae]
MLDPSVLWNINHVLVNQVFTRRFSTDSHKFRFRIHFTDFTCGIAAIHQIVNDQETFAVMLWCFQNCHITLVIMVIARDTHRIHIANAQLASENSSGN